LSAFDRGGDRTRERLAETAALCLKIDERNRIGHGAAFQTKREARVLRKARRTLNPLSDNKYCRLRHAFY
jgi:hypothetical protein